MTCFCKTCDDYFEHPDFHIDECFKCRKERAIKARVKIRELESMGFIIDYKLAAVVKP